MAIKKDLQKLVNRDLISSAQAKKIRDFYYHNEDNSPFSVANILYYLGGFLITFAVIFWCVQHWDEIGKVVHLLISLAFVVVFFGIGWWFERKKLKRPADVLFVASIVSFPFFLWTLFDLIGIDISHDFWNAHFNEGGAVWIVFDLVVLTFSGAFLFHFKRPLLSLPFVHFAWFLFLALLHTLFAADFLEWITLFTGLVFFACGYFADVYKKPYMVFWPWLYACVLTFGALLNLRFDSNPEILYLLFIGVYGVSLLYLSSHLKQKLFLVFGAIGIFWFINDLAWEFFEDSLGFTFALILSGFLSIGFAYFLQKYYKKQFKK